MFDLLQKVYESLGPWPPIQFAAAVLILYVGLRMLQRGMQEKKTDTTPQDQQARWELQKAIAHIHENSFEIVKLLEQQNQLSQLVLAALNRLVDTRWNQRQ